jgi:hypothetical protein
MVILFPKYCKTLQVPSDSCKKVTSLSYLPKFNLIKSSNFSAFKPTFLSKLTESNGFVVWGRHFFSRSQSYKNLISSFFRFLLLSLSVCSIRQYCLCYKMAKLNSEKWKKIFVLRRKKFGRKQRQSKTRKITKRNVLGVLLRFKA